MPDPQVSASVRGAARQREPCPLRRKLERPVVLGEDSAGPGWPRAVVCWQWVRAGPSTQAGRSGIDSDKVIELINKITRVRAYSKLSGDPPQKRGGHCSSAPCPDSAPFSSGPEARLWGQTDPDSPQVLPLRTHPFS